MYKLEEAFTQFINNDVNKFKMSELFAMFCDYVLRGKLKISDSEKEVCITKIFNKSFIDIIFFFRNYLNLLFKYLLI